MKLQAPQLEVDLFHATGGADDVHAQSHALVLVGRAQEVAHAVGDVVHRHDRPVRFLFCFPIGNAKPCAEIGRAHV